MPSQPDLSVEAILAQGRRDFGAGNDFMRLHTAHGRAVRAAFLAGHANGSRGLASIEDADRAWRRSRSKAALEGNPAGLDIIGIAVVCDDPRAAGREGWRIVAARRDAAWIASIGQSRVDLIVKLSACRSLI